MVKHKRFIIKMATLLMVYSVIVPTGVGSMLLIGEPQLPKKMLKEDVQL